jgi:hypothetical protein
MRVLTSPIRNANVVGLNEDQSRRGRGKAAVGVPNPRAARRNLSGLIAVCRGCRSRPQLRICPVKVVVTPRNRLYLLKPVWRDPGGLLPCATRVPRLAGRDPLADAEVRQAQPISVRHGRSRRGCRSFPGCAPWRTLAISRSTPAEILLPSPAEIARRRE